MLTYFTRVSSQSGETLGSVNESIAGKEKTPQLSTDIQKDNLTLPGETSDANSTRHFFTYTQVLWLHCKTATFSVAFCVLNHPCLLMLEAIRASGSGRSRNIAWVITVSPAVLSFFKILLILLVASINTSHSHS